MRLNRRQLRRLIESAIYEQGQAKGQVVPKEVRAEMRKLRLRGITSLAFDGEGNQGLALRVSDHMDRDGSSTKLAVARLKKLYGEDKVMTGVVKRLQGGSAGVKGFDGKQLDRETFKKDGLAKDILDNEKSIFIKMD
jgi:hypothetical protein